MHGLASFVLTRGLDTLRCTSWLSWLRSPRNISPERSSASSSRVLSSAAKTRIAFAQVTLSSAVGAFCIAANDSRDRDRSLRGATEPQRRTRASTLCACWNQSPAGTFVADLLHAAIEGRPAFRLAGQMGKARVAKLADAPDLGFKI